MRCTFRAYSILVIVGVVACSTASAGLSVVNLSGADVVFDDVASLYWYQDLGYFQDREYEEQIDLIAGLNLAPAHAGLNNWALATLLQMEGLYLNGKPAIMSSFLTDEEGEWFGRYEEADGHDAHFLGGVKDDESLTPLGICFEPDDQTHPWLGAWAVATGSHIPSFDPPSPPTVPAPGAFVLAIAGLGALAASRRRFQRA